jgi:ectoine hydroxylase-related dioxygenase (phytanoyl-CoA dioxygenase family)
MALSQEQIGQFHREGFLKLGQVLDDDQLRSLAERIDTIASGEARTSGRIRYEKDVADDIAPLDRVWQIWDGHLEDDVIMTTCSNENILDAVQSLVGPNVRLYSDQVLMKPAFHGSAVAWHQDYPYWAFDRPELVTCWLAIDGATAENGCMRVIPGSHRQGVYPTRDDRRVRYQEAVDRLQQVSVELPAGHCMFHHCLTLHATSANTSPHRRRAIAITYMPADLQWNGDPSLAREYRLVRSKESKEFADVSN